MKTRVSPIIILALHICIVMQLQAQKSKKAVSVFEHKLTAAQRAEVEEMLRKSTHPEQRAFYEKVLKTNTPIAIGSGETMAVLNYFDGDNPVYIASDNETGANLIKARYLNYTSYLGLNLNGEDIPMGIWEVHGIRQSHKAIKGRIIKKDVESLVEAEKNHGTHVAGTMIASGKFGGLLGEMARGMAPAGKLDCYNSFNDIIELDNAAKNGLLISNHSYSEKCGWIKTNAYTNQANAPLRWCWYGGTSNRDKYFGFYDEKAKNYDKVAYENPNLLICVAAGNSQFNLDPADNTTKYQKVGLTFEEITQEQAAAKSNTRAGGFDCIPGSNTGKNVLTVGSVDAILYQGPATFMKAPTSSVGPTDDGRIKPDLVARGENVFSLGGKNDEQFLEASGTSCATPMVSGAAALLQQLYKRRHNNYMRAATLKALLIHTAEECGLHPGPDYYFGHGLVNAQKAAFTILEQGISTEIIERRLMPNEKCTIRVNAVPNPAGLKATLAWNDPPGVVSELSLDPVDKKLVNDLDVRIILPDGSEVKPWILNPANPQNAAQRGDNVLDNVEVVHHPAGALGNVLVIVSHKGNIGSGQDFSLIISGCGFKSVAVNPEINIYQTPSAYVENVTFSQINNTTTLPAFYSNFNYLRAEVCATRKYKLSVRVRTVESENNVKKIVKVWIDFNANGTFEEATELVLKTTQYIVENNNTLSTDVVIPAYVGNTQSKTVQMRVIVKPIFSIENFNQSMANLEPVGPANFGEIEDYTVRIHDNQATTNIWYYPNGPLDEVHSNLYVYTNAKVKIDAKTVIGCKCEVMGNGTMHFTSTGYLAGPGDLEINNFGKLIIENNQGIGASDTSGVIRLTGKRKISKNTLIEYRVSDGVTGMGLPDTVYSLTVSSNPWPEGLRLSKGVHILEDLEIKTGVLNLNNKPLVLVSNGGTTARLRKMSAGCSIVGNTFTQEQYVPGNTPAWYFLGSPIKDMTLQNWAASIPIRGIPGAAPGGKNVMFYHEPNTPIANSIQNGYYYPVNIHSSTPLGEGMVVYLHQNFFQNGAKMRLTGEPNFVPLPGEFQFQVTYTPATGFDGGGFNLVANPFPSEINWDGNGWTKTNISGAYWVWNKDKYATYVNRVGINGATKYIATMQGFFIRATGNNPVLKCTEAVKSSGLFLTQNFLRVAEDEPSLLKLALWHEQEQKDECVLRFEAGTSKAFDPDFDAHKFINPAFNIASKPLPGLLLSISTQAMPTMVADTIPLWMSAPTATATLLKITDIHSSLAGKLLLWDRVENTTTPIQPGYTVLLNTASSQNEQQQNRFAIIILPETVTQVPAIQLATPTLAVYPNPAAEQVYLHLRHTPTTDVAISWIDALGRVVHRQTINQVSSSEPVALSKPSNAKGVYRIKAELLNQGNTILYRSVLLE